ncbi:MAG: DMT family transporter [Halomonas sp.]|uniref:DMT family transporter n=1 Tax=Halomonas sulfidivorans TaxID=2733488 RepID=A0ABX7WIC3_9GAMM|nr:DMT family transporter [Halomonas sulfidivorans]MDX5376023.1 DMT family transporter [Halomonas sp.]QTP60115.1 DMT family transporter [Halomonas sulfidivorans]
MIHSLSHRQQGLLLTGGGALIISPDALLIKLIGLPDGEILLWRGLLTALGFVIIMLVRHGAGTVDAYRRCGWTGIGVALLFSLSTFGFVLGNQYTKGGNVLMILAGAPLIAALFSRLFLGERLPRRTWLAIWLCLVGTSLIVLDDTGVGSWVGNGFALLAATALAANFTLCRTRPGVDMSPMLTLSGLIVAAIAASFGLAEGGIALPSTDSLLLLVLLCLMLLPLGFTLIQRGPLYLPAAEVGLLMLLEVVVGTLWVWWILGERPAPVALIGGALVLGTLLAKGLYERRLERRLRGRDAAERELC